MPLTEGRKSDLIELMVEQDFRKVRRAQTLYAHSPGADIPVREDALA
jgi:hypothetical protein